MGNKLKLAGAGAGFVLLSIIGFIIRIGLAVLAVFMLIWNITDIQNVGANFWNVTWIVLAVGYLLGVIGSFFRGRS